MAGMMTIILWIFGISFGVLLVYTMWCWIAGKLGLGSVPNEDAWK